MLTISELLLEGEVFIGDYNVEVARWKDGEWRPTIPPLYAIVTDHRLVLQSTSRKQQEPAVIPAGYIERIQEFNHQFRQGMILHLTPGHRIALFIPNLRRDEILNNMYTITAPSSKPKRHQITLDLGGLQKLIKFMAEL